MADDAVDPFERVDFFLDRNLVGRSRLEPPADAGVQALRVLTDDDEVDVRAAATLERAEPIVEQTNRPVVHIEIERKARPEQDVARVAVVGHARIAEGANQDRVEGPQGVVTVGRQGHAGRQIVRRTPGERHDIDAAGRHQHPQGLRDHLRPYTVARDHCDAHARRL
jgi:hypothetical protein